MPVNAHPIEELAAICLERMQIEGEAALEAMCRDCPDQAPALRHLVGQLQQPGPTGTSDGEDLPERIGEYRIVRRLGGGKGAVYLAVQDRLHRQVVLQLLRPGIPGRPRSRERLRREIEALSRLDHPHLGTVFDAGEVDGALFLAMRYVRGRTLGQWIGELPPGGLDATKAAPPEPWSPLRGLLLLLEKVARALHAAHDVGVVHRDVEPANIVIDESGEPAILDFGLAHDDRANEAQSACCGEDLVTTGYLAPEQIEPGLGAVDRRTDVYQLGVTAYQCLTQRLPFEAPSREGLCGAIVAGAVTEPRLLLLKAGPELTAVVMRAMAREPGHRFATALEFAEELQRLCMHVPIRTRRAGPWRRLWRWCRRNRDTAVFLPML